MIKKPIFEQIFSSKDILNARPVNNSSTLVTYELPFGNKHWYFDSEHGRRIGKLEIQSELVSQSPLGDIVELGCGPGHNIAHFMWSLEAINREGVTIYGFDTFTGYIEEHINEEGSGFAASLKENQKAGRWNISEEVIQKKINRLGAITDVKLVRGDICETTKNFEPKSGKISIVNIDTNVYKPALEALYNLEKYFVKHTLLIVDSGFLKPGDQLQGEHRALAEYAGKRKVPILRTNWGRLL